MSTNIKRFKTEEEFIAEFGEGWRGAGLIRAGWVKEMDELFGQPYDPLKPISWTISEDMLTEDLPETAGKVKILRAILDFRKSVIARLSYTNTIDSGGLMRTIKYKTSFGFHCTFYLNVSPTGNCQLASISSFDQLLASGVEGEELKEVMKWVGQTVAAKYLLLFDIKKAYLKQIKSLKTLFIEPYESSNGSSMLAGIIDTR